MTAPLLLVCICSALLLQVAVGVGVALWRRPRLSLAADGRPDAEGPSARSGAWPGWRSFRVARRNFEDAGRAQCSFHLMPADGAVLPPFRPGQFLTLRLQIAGVGKPDRTTTITRCYSLSDRPSPDAYRITVKRATAPPGRPECPPGLASAHLLDSVQENDVIDIKAPAGQFVLDPDPLVPAVLISGGIGITPMMSMLRWCDREQPDRVIYLFYGVRGGRDHGFKAVLEDMAASHPNFHLNVIYNRPDPEDIPGADFQHTGNIDINLLKQHLPRGRHAFYVCGPPAMMDSLVPALRAWGVADDDIHFEAFGPASASSTAGLSPDVALAGTNQLDIAFRRTGRTLHWDGQDANLLDFADRHGVAIESGCRSGSCGSCETRLLSGQIRYAHKPEYDISEGCCLVCVATPASPLVLEA